MSAIPSEMQAAKIAAVTAMVADWEDTAKQHGFQETTVQANRKDRRRDARHSSDRIHKALYPSRRKSVGSTAEAFRDVEEEQPSKRPRPSMLQADADPSTLDALEIPRKKPHGRPVTNVSS